MLIKNKKNNICLKAYFIIFLLVVSIFGILYRIIDIQFINGKKYQSLSKSNYLSRIDIPAKRGIIYADNNEILALSTPLYKLYIDPTIPDDKLYDQNINALCKKLSDIYKDKTPNAYLEYINNARQNKKRYLQIGKSHINFYDKNELLKNPLCQKGRYKGGIIFEQHFQRFYPFGDLCARTIGYIDHNRNGKVGIEKSFDKYLKGTDGNILCRKTLGNPWIPIYSADNIESTDGVNIVTTINTDIQNITHNFLLQELKETNAHHGCAIVMETDTGYIKSLVNLTYDTKSNDYKEIYNYALGHYGIVEPGSTFKLVSMLALFDEYNIDIDQIVHTGNGTYKIGPLVMHDVNSGYGDIPLRKAFEVSSNVGIARIIDQYFLKYPNKFLKYISKLKLDKPLDINMEGIGIPYVKTPKDPTWSRISIPWMSIGYELKISPLQLMNVYNAVANNGKMMKPILIKQIIDGQGNNIESFNSTTLVPKICSSATLDKLKTLLEGVVDNHIMKNSKSSSYYKIAGKTGTASKLVNGKYTNKNSVMFIGYFPTSKPKYTCLVLVDDPQGKKHHFANQVAFPVVKNIMNKIVTFDTDFSKTLDFKILPNDIIDDNLSLPDSKIKLQSLKNMNVKEVIPILLKNNYKFKINFNEEKSVNKVTIVDNVVNINL